MHVGNCAHRISFSLFITAGFASAAFGQAAGSVSTLPYASSATLGGPTKKSVALNFDGDRTRDVATVVGGTLRIHLAPDTIDGALDVETSVIADICVLQGGGSNGRDALAIATNSGLTVLTSENLGSGGISQAVTGGLSKIQSRDLVPGGAIDFFALNAAGTAVLSGTFQSGSISGLTTIVTGFGTASDLRLVEWDGAGLPEVAVLRATGIRVHNLSGGQVASISGSPKTIGVVNHKALGARELVAWTYEDTVTGNNFLRVNGLGYSTGQQPAINLGLADITAISTGDLTNDGYAEVYLTHDFAAAQPLFVNQSTTASNSATFGATNNVLVTLGSWATYQNGFCATGAIGDLDNDGDNDLYVPCDVEGVESRFLFRNPTVNEDALRVTLENAGVGIYGNFNITFALDLPAALQGSVDYAQIVLWRADYPGMFDDAGIQGFTAEREAEPVGDFHYDVSGWSYGAGSNQTNPQLYFSMPYDVGDARDYYQADPGAPQNSGWFAVDVQVRLYDLDASGNVVAVYPSTITTITNDPHYVEELAAGSNTSGSYVYANLLDVIGTSGGSQTGGGTTVQRPVNPYGGTPTPPASP
jgi:hypothetical protein